MVNSTLIARNTAVSQVVNIYQDEVDVYDFPLVRLKTGNCVTIRMIGWIWLLLGNCRRIHMGKIDLTTVLPLWFRLPYRNTFSAAASAAGVEICFFLAKYWESVSSFWTTYLVQYFQNYMPRAWGTRYWKYLKLHFLDKLFNSYAPDDKDEKDSIGIIGFLIAENICWIMS